MKTLNLENLGVHELDAKEMKEIDGGGVPWGKIYKWGKRTIEALAIADAIDDFVEGWNSKQC